MYRVLGVNVGSSERVLDESRECDNISRRDHPLSSTTQHNIGKRYVIVSDVVFTLVLVDSLDIHTNTTNISKCYPNPFES